MVSTHLKLLLAILIISFCITPCFARGRRTFRVDFPYFDALYDDFIQYDSPNVYEANDKNTFQSTSDRVKSDNSTQANQVISATQPTGVVLNIDKAYFSKDSQNDNKSGISNSAAPFRVSTSFFYPVVLSEKWKDALESIANAELGFSYAESKSGVFTFSPGLKFGYSYFIGKNGYELNYHMAYFSLPLDFSFYMANTRKATISIGPYYSFDFLKFQEEYNDVELYRENNLGLDVGVKFSQNVSSFLDINLALGTLYSFSSSVFLLARAGISFDWRL